MSLVRVTPWTCPICDRRTARVDALQHGVTRHPANLARRMTITDRLWLIPALAREAALTLGAPNPSAQADRTKRIVQAHPPLPIDAVLILVGSDNMEVVSHTVAELSELPVRIQLLPIELAEL